MSNRTNQPSALFTNSGCLTGDALTLFVSGSLPAAEHREALKHLGECPLCTDAIEGLRLWLNNNDSENIDTSVIPSSPGTGAPDISNMHHGWQQNKVNPTGPDIRLFHHKTDEINNRIKQRLFTHARHEAAESKRLSYKPFVWMSVAATILLFITIGYVLWLHNQYASQQLARVRAEEMLMLDSTSTQDTIKISMPANKQLALNDRNEYISQDESDMNTLDAIHEQVDDISLSVQMQENEMPEVKPDRPVQVNDRNISPEMAAGSAQGKKEADKEKNIYTLVDEMPVYPGGDAARTTFLKENLRYPVQAVENGVQGIVYIGFVVKSDGQLSEINVLRGIGGGCEQEAIRVIKKMPHWIPGKQNGKTVDVFLTLPIIFKLEK